MLRVLLAMVVLSGCRTAPPAPEPKRTPPPYDWKKDGDLRQAAADDLCRKELPDCAYPFAAYSLPPSPCGNRGTACMEQIPRSAGRWSCACDACTSPSDCKADEHCGTTAGGPCSIERTPLRCLRGPALSPGAPCLAPPRARPPQ